MVLTVGIKFGRASEIYPILRVENLAVYFYHDQRFIRAVDGASIQLEEGKITSLVGFSGSGKTQLALSILGLVEGVPGIVGGAVYYQGENLWRGMETFIRRWNSDGSFIIRKDIRQWKRNLQRRLKPIRGREIGMIFQHPVSGLDRLLTIERQFVITLQKKHRSAPREIREQTYLWLQRVGFRNPQAVLPLYPRELSGGMCQRVMIALALCLEPKILIADEPTTSLDAPVQKEILELLRDLQQRLGLTVLLISHNMAIAHHFCDFVYVMQKGCIVDQGLTSDFFRGEKRHPVSQKLIDCVTQPQCLDNSEFQ